MKNQYFADKRDFIKYDLLIEIVEKSPAIARLTNIPMLTMPDGTGQGNQQQYVTYVQGNRRNDLFHFLRYCLARQDRNVRNLRVFFEARSYGYSPFRDADFFSHEIRNDYFAAVPTAFLRDALVFIDPDTGLQHPNVNYMVGQGIDKYLFWDDVLGLLGRMADTSVLVVYQHLQRNANLAGPDLLAKAQEMHQHTNLPIISLREGDLAFLITSKSQPQQVSLAQLLSAYAPVQGLSYALVP